MSRQIRHFHALSLVQRAKNIPEAPGASGITSFGAAFQSREKGFLPEKRTAGRFFRQARRISERFCRRWDFFSSRDA